MASLPAAIDEAGTLEIGDQLSYFSRHGSGLWHDSITVVSLSQALGGTVNLRRISLAKPDHCPSEGEFFGAHDILRVTASRIRSFSSLRPAQLPDNHRRYACPQTR